MDSYPVSSQLLEYVPEPLLAGVLGGVGFMGLALALLLGSACVVSRKMGRRCRRKKDAQHLPRHEPYAETDYSRFADLGSVCSNSSLATLPRKDSKPNLTFPVLPHIRRGLGQPATNASALVLQMEHEREKGNLNHCLKLAQEREELEKELHRAPASPWGFRRQMDSPTSVFKDKQTETQMDDSCCQKRSSLSRGSVSTLSFRGNKRAERANSARSSRAEALFSDATEEEASVEMSVDEPELEESMTTPSRLMLHHRIASHLQHSHSPAKKSWYEDMRSIASCNQAGSPFGGGSIRSTPPDSRLCWKSVLRSQSLDLRRQREEEFLTPDAWINSLSQENCSLLSSGRPGSSFLENQALSSRKISTSPSTSKLPPLQHSVSPEGTSEKLPLKKKNISLNSGYTNKRMWPSGGVYREARFLRDDGECLHVCPRGQPSRRVRD
ncbi:unnamed protein product [Tetraodon nigroviridis]|uniref:(spotted green pufferfish) hypothetical protein n=1 Tax=Tetraodon nigroviridis TaxID=99883 RepID=Q4RK87_TETNG|nr:unnamed protein product [Tetraodon nigroviridis]